MGLLFMGFALLALVMGAIIFPYEDRITSKLEQILDIKIKRFDCKAMGCYTYEGLLGFF